MSPSKNAIQPLEVLEQEESAVAALEVQLQEVKAEHLIERFVWSFIVISMVLAFISRDLSSFSAFFLALLALVLLMLLAQWWKVPVVTHYLDKVFDRFIPRKLDETEQ